MSNSPENNLPEWALEPTQSQKIAKKKEFQLVNQNEDAELLESGQKPLLEERGCFSQFLVFCCIRIFRLLSAGVCAVGFVANLYTIIQQFDNHDFLLLWLWKDTALRLFSALFYICAFCVELDFKFVTTTVTIMEFQIFRGLFFLYLGISTVDSDGIWPNFPDIAGSMMAIIGVSYIIMSVVGKD